MIADRNGSYVKYTKTLTLVEAMCKQVWDGDMDASPVLADLMEEEGGYPEEWLSVARRLRLLERNNEDWRGVAAIFSVFANLQPVFVRPAPGGAEYMHKWFAKIGAVQQEKPFKPALLPFCATLVVGGRLTGRLSYHATYCSRFLGSARRRYRYRDILGVYFVPHTEAHEVQSDWHLHNAGYESGAFVRANMREDGFYRRIMPPEPVDDFT